MELDKLNKKVVYDPLTGGEQTIYWDNANTFMMSIPHQTLPIKINPDLPKYKFTNNEDGSVTWELK